MIRIPAIDIIDGKCVRLTKGEFDKSTYYNLNPVELAKRYEDAGAKYIHIVDLDAARGSGSNIKVLTEIRRKTGLKIQTGGGIRSADQIERYLKEGMYSVIIGSAAQKERDKVKKWIGKYGSTRIIIGADVRDKKIAIDGWMNTSDENIIDFIFEYKLAGATTFLCTDIHKDGMLGGTSNRLYRNLRSKFPDLKLIASGGVSCMEDLRILEGMGMYSCVIGKALFENKISLTNLFAKTYSQ